MGMVLAILYAPFILLLAGLVIFGGTRQRRICLLALVAGGGASFILHFAYPFFYPQMSQFERTVAQVLHFPFLVTGTWLALTVVNRLRG